MKRNSEDDDVNEDVVDLDKSEVLDEDDQEEAEILKDSSLLMIK